MRDALEAPCARAMHAAAGREMIERLFIVSPGVASRRPGGFRCFRFGHESMIIEILVVNHRGVNIEFFIFGNKWKLTPYIYIPLIDGSLD